MDRCFFFVWSNIRFLEFWALNIFFCPSMLSCCDEMARDQLKGSPYLIKRQSYTSIVEVGSIVHKELQIIMEGVASNLLK